MPDSHGAHLIFSRIGNYLSFKLQVPEKINLKATKQCMVSNQTEVIYKNEIDR